MSDQWFERGVQDAQNDQLNTTYYQHYYYYRMGYDQARRQMRKPVLSVRPRRGAGPALLSLLLLGLIGASYYYWQQPSTQTSLPTAVVSATARPTLPAPTALAPTQPPVAEPPTLRPDGFALIVNTNGAPLRARAEPTRSGSNVLARLPEGSRVRLLEGPVEADGYLWWRVEGEAGAGWVAQGEPGGAAWLEPLAN